MIGVGKEASNALVLAQIQVSLFDSTSWLQRCVLVHPYGLVDSLLLLLFFSFSCVCVCGSIVFGTIHSNLLMGMRQIMGCVRLKCDLLVLLFPQQA